VVTLDAATALIVVDVQNDFADPAGSLAVATGVAVVPVANRAIGEARVAAASVVYTQDWHPAHTPHFAQDGGIWPVHCVQETWGAAFHPDLDVDGEIVRKGADGEDGYSAFSVRDPMSGAVSSTALERILRERGITRVVVLGLATDYCVLETVRDARELGFAVEVVFDGIRAVNLHDGDGDVAIRRMRDAGAELV
jgi:nicotinamidase/pyrazinamidase